MKYINLFKTHASYEEKLNVGGVDFKIPNVSYCKDANDVHFNPYNLIKFYVGEITGTTPETVSIYTDKTNSIPIQVSEGNKWYTYLLPKGKGLFRIIGNTVNKVVVKANINTNSQGIIPSSTVEASFKGSNASNVTSMFSDCNGLTSLDLRNFNTSNVTNMNRMFEYCTSLTSLDLRNFNTSKVISMYYMFTECASLKELDLSGWDTSKVTNMESMFSNCAKLESLDLSGWDTSNVTNMNYIFSGCAALNKITMKGCSEATIEKITEQLSTAGIIGNITDFVTE